MTKEKPKIQVQNRLERLKVPADKLSWNVFTMTPAEIVKTIQDGEWLGAIENPKAPTDKQAQTRYTLEHVEDYSDMRPTNFFDYAVLSVCATAYKEGWHGLTIDQICRVLTHANNRKISDALKAAVRASVERMMMTRITINLEDTAKKMRYEFKRLSISAPILPCKVEVWEVNGQKTTYVKFLDESPLMEVSEAKKHILTIGTKLLDVAGLHSSELSIERKWYLVFLAMGKKQHPKGFGQEITFKALYEFTGTANAPRWKKKRIRDEFLQILENLAREKSITFEVKKDAQGTFKSIKIS